MIDLKDAINIIELNRNRGYFLLMKIKVVASLTDGDIKHY